MSINKLEMYGYVLQNLVSRNEKPIDVEVVKDVLYLVDEFIENAEKVEKGKNQFKAIDLMDERGRPLAVCDIDKVGITASKLSKL